MSEARVLWLVFRYSNPTALARKVQDGVLFPGLRTLECRGLISCRRDRYRLTRQGREALAMTYAIARLVSPNEYSAR
jgi:DNA-binding PadR family transcriptional regulator